MATMKQYAETGSLDGNAKGVYKRGQDKKFEHTLGLGHPSAMRGGGDKAAAAKAAKAEAEAAAAAAEAPREVGDSLFKFVGQHETPVYRVEETAAGGGSALAVTVELPRIERIAQLTLDITGTQFQLRGASYRLKLELPKTVDVNAVKARFTSKRKELKVTLPVLE
jgi:HSP20 family molecular chaperone IbpA